MDDSRLTSTDVPNTTDSPSHTLCQQYLQHFLGSGEYREVEFQYADKCFAYFRTFQDGRYLTNSGLRSARLYRASCTFDKMKQTIKEL